MAAPTNPSPAKVLQREQMLTKKNYIPELNGLRGIAVLAMLIDHIHIDFQFKQYFQGTTHLTSGVDIFFVMSGFLTTRILLSDQETIRAKISFYVRRFARLMPAYLLFLSLVSVIWGVGPELPWSLTYTFNYGRFFGYFLSEARPLAHTWSLCVEEHFYLVWPWILWTFKKQSKLLCVLAIACGLFFPFLTDKQAGEQYLHYIRVFQPTHARLMSISIGCLIALYEEKIMLVPNIMLTLAVLFGSFSIILGYPSVLHPIGVNISDTPLAVSLVQQNFIAASIFSMALWSSLAECRFLSVLFTDRRLCRTGKISYGVYLYHFPIYWLFSINGPSAEPSQYKPWLAMVCVFIMSAISNRYYEEPIRKWARNIIPRHRKEVLLGEINQTRVAL